MLKKIITIKNVGRFRNSAAAGNPQLAKHTFIVGANGYGKTTICAVLRSLQTGDPSHILGRKSLGTVDASAIELLLDTGAARFDGAKWDVTRPTIAIFDGVFVAGNVHSGEVVDIEHKRNLYHVIVGDEGVKLAMEDAELAAASRAKTSEISAAAKVVQPHLPAGMKLETFLALPVEVDIDARVREQTQTVEAVRQAGAIRDRAALAEFIPPILATGFAELLSRTIDDIAQDAERLLGEHLAAHSMTAEGNWIAEGIEHAGSACPFCGQDIQGLPLIAAYRAVFSARYKALATDIATMRKGIDQTFGEAALARLDAVAEQNKSGIEFWAKYCTFDAAPLAMPAALAPTARALLAAALVLLDQKATAPLEPIFVNGEFATIRDAFDEAARALHGTNLAIRSVDMLIAQKKAATGAADVKTAEAELARRQAIMTRHGAAAAGLCCQAT